MKILKLCFSLRVFWWTTVGLGLVAAALLIWGVAPSLVVAALPVLGIIACLLPCLLPLYWLRQTRNKELK